MTLRNGHNSDALKSVQNLVQGGMPLHGGQVTHVRPKKLTPHSYAYRLSTNQAKVRATARPGTIAVLPQGSAHRVIFQSPSRVSRRYLKPSSH